MRHGHVLVEPGWVLFDTVGAIALALTGAEALHADLDHLGRLPIQFAWIGMVLPALALNYMGQGALLIGTPAAIDDPSSDSSCRPGPCLRRCWARCRQSTRRRPSSPMPTR